MEPLNSYTKAAKRSMTFTGCWTCKKRRVKCDERLPHCENCERLGVDCEGYGIRLQWMSDALSSHHDRPTPNGYFRGRIRIGFNKGPAYSTEEVDRFLVTIEDDASLGAFSQRGPFCVFSLYNEELESRLSCYTMGPDQAPAGNTERYGTRRAPPSPNSSQDADSYEMQSLSRSEVDHLHHSHMPASNSPIDPSLFGLEPQDDVPVFLETADETRSNEDEAYFRVITSSNHSPQTNVPEGLEDDASSINLDLSVIEKPWRSRSFHSIPMGGIHSSLSGDSTVDMLMNHYMVHIADLLQPIHHPQNPYRNIYVPAALEVASSVVRHHNSGSPTKIQSVLYHSLLASAAFHLSRCDPSRFTYHQVGERHRRNALHLLQLVIESAPPAEYKVLLMAMLSLVTIGVMSGEETDFAVHLDGTKVLRESRRRWKMISSTTRQLHEMSAFLCLLARTTSRQPSPVPWGAEESWSVNEDILRNPGPGRCYEYMYGISPTIAASIQETCRLSEYIARYKARQEEMPDSLLQACEDLGNRLLSWSISSETVTCFSTDNLEMRTIFDHYANAWHTAALIYYYQSIQDFHTEGLEEEENFVAEHMHAVEDLKVKCQSDRTARMAPITWPAFIASCDATNRQRWTRWWERVQSYNIANIQRQWDIVQKIWKIRDMMEAAGSPKRSWIDIFNDNKFHLLPI